MGTVFHIEDTLSRAMTRCAHATTTKDATSDLTLVTVAPGLRSPNPVSDRRKVEKEPVEKEQRDHQAHHAGGVDAREDPAVPLVDDNDLADRNFSQWGAIGPECDCPQPVESRGALRLPHAVRATRIVVERESHLGRSSSGAWSPAVHSPPHRPSRKSVHGRIRMPSVSLAIGSMDTSR